jgi:hypothetical protein
VLFRQGSPRESRTSRTSSSDPGAAPKTVLRVASSSDDHTRQRAMREVCARLQKVDVRHVPRHLHPGKTRYAQPQRVPILVATPKPIDLFVARSRRPESVSDLTTLEREQLRIAWRGFDEEDLDAKAGLTAEESERSFLAIVEIRNLADADGNALYDAFTYVDQGAIFRAGTKEEIGGVAQGGVTLKEKNDALRVALQSALFSRAAKLATKKGTDVI